MGRELSECTEKKANNWAKPSKVDKKKEVCTSNPSPLWQSFNISFL